MSQPFFTDFNPSDFVAAVHGMFRNNLAISLFTSTTQPIEREFLKLPPSQQFLMKHIKEIYYLGEINDTALLNQTQTQASLFASEPDNRWQLTLNGMGASNDYDRMLVMGVVWDNRIPTRTDLAAVARRFNMQSKGMPVVVVHHYGGYLCLAVCERNAYVRTGIAGERVGKVSLIKDIRLHQTNRAHELILGELSANKLRERLRRTATFREFYSAWRQVLDINALNNNFYKDLFQWYEYAKKVVKFPKPATDPTPDDVYQAQSVIRLITRLMFVWFVKEKELIREETFSVPALRGLLRDFDPDSAESSQFYQAILQNLFFATLNTPMDKDAKPAEKRRFVKKGPAGKSQDYMNHLVYRSDEAFIQPEKALALFAEVPFLNGGLFECLDFLNDNKEEDRYDGFSSTPGKAPFVPNNLFFSKSLDTKGLVRGLITIFESYKFTVAENTPQEEEVALDPELLGKVFENLLASYNPETETTARKATGSFYTPREIVDYMTEQSLVTYLERKVPAAQGQVLELFQAEEHNLSPETVTALVEALSECKVLDPACGSGAYPMGVLHKMVALLRVLDPNNLGWKKALLAQAERDLERAEAMDDEVIREQAVQGAEDRKAYIKASFDRDDHEFDYQRKLFLIENCLYGVDIQQIAVQISKLRFFISLLCDQTVADALDNRGLLSMPNLETKLVAANSLLKAQPDKDKKKGVITMGMTDPGVKAAEEALRKVRSRIFFARRWDQKKKLREDEKTLREKLRKELVRANYYDKEAADKIAAWNPFDVLHSANFFESEWMFGFNTGFDIVIGNPPYVQIQKLKDDQKKPLEKQGYATWSKLSDLYALFYERGIELLKDGGVLAYITSNKWMRTDYGDTLRGWLVKEANPITVIDFGMALVFDTATVLTNILIATRERYTGTTAMCRVQKDYDPDAMSLHDYVQTHAAPQQAPGSSAWVPYTADELRIRKLVMDQGTPLCSWKNLTINYGLKTGLNDAFYLTGQQREDLIAEDPKSAEVIVPLLRGEHVKAYRAAFDDLWMLYIPWHFPLHTDSTIQGPSEKAEKEFATQYPAVYKHLCKFKEDLSARNKAETGIRYEWYALQRWGANYWQDFQKSKIIYPNMTNSLPFYYDEDQHYFINDKAFIMTGSHLKYLTAFLNSALFRFCFKNNFPELLGDTREVRKVFMDKIPVKVPDAATEAVVERLVEYVQWLRAREKPLNDRVSNDHLYYKFIEVIDALVYEIYFTESVTRQSAGVLADLAAYPWQPASDTAVAAFWEWLSVSENPVRNMVIKQMIVVPEIRIVLGKPL